MVEFRCKNCATRYSALDSRAGETTTCEQCGHTIEIPYPPLELSQEVTEGGSVVYRHEQGSQEQPLATGDQANIKLISTHVETHVGKIDNVLHELVSELVHIDIHCVAPTPDMPYHTLVTSGMSDRPMACPEGLEACAFAELLIRLPADWPITREAFRDEKHYWPIRWLKILARFPHEYDTWLFEGHTIPNGDPPGPFAEGTKFSGWMLHPAVLAPPEFHTLPVSAEKSIHFFAIYPLYDSEMQLKLNKGAEKLIAKFEKHGVTEVVDIHRPDVTRGFWPFG